MNHLDLGCGLSPKNPYNFNNLFGCDIRDLSSELEPRGIKFKKANLAFEPIPFQNNFFDSISAFDFLEHIPRQSFIHDSEVINPFVDLMNEIYRVLKPNGVFFASTPIYPHPMAFVDPTHVNIMSDKSYTYFIGSQSHGKMYGFNGNFEKIRVYLENPSNFQTNFKPTFIKTIRRIYRKFLRGGLSHQVWELRAIK
jgi:SAM-dependent methyltransferase